jgi:hypothetical protein
MEMANARKAGLPDWMKWGFGGLGLLVLLAAAMIVMGHNPLQHFSGHMNMDMGG